jgi:purine-binding chemotaxis protein CheW
MERTGGIDWDAVKARLAAAGARRDGAERAQKTLAERARLLAQPPALAGYARVAAVALDAGGERYAVVGGALLRVERAPAPARLPGAPAFVLGVVPLAGRPLALVDLPALLGGGAPRATPAAWAVVLGGGRAALAVAADAVALAEVAPEGLHRGFADADGLRLGLDDDGRLVVQAQAVLARARARIAEGRA